jgi:glycosyltransferase involved in cell wall biosynthesis
MEVSIVIPAKNEADNLFVLIPKIQQAIPDAEIIIVNDGSGDNTSEVCGKFNVKEVVHPYSKGNGASIKSGARHATGDVIVFMDGDGQHSPEDVVRLLKSYKAAGFQMVVGARGKESQANHGRWIGNSIYNFIASYIVGHKVEDLTSGFRVVEAKKFKEFLYLLPNGFSYPTTITMAFFRAGYGVKYEPIVAAERQGDSHLRFFHDGLRFLLIIFKVATLYSPLKIFFPVAAVTFSISMFYYLYTYFSEGRLTNMVVILFMMSILIFMIGLVSEQITMLLYKDSDSRE